MKITWKMFLAIALLIVWLILAWFIPALIHLQNSSLWFLRIGLAVLGSIGFIAFLWWEHQQQKAEAEEGGEGAPAGDEHDEIAVLFRLAEEKLRSSPQVQSSKVSRLPVILLVGDPGSGKTTAVLNSGLEPELLAGHVYEDTTVASTQSVNIWVAQHTIVVEVGTPIVQDPVRWLRLVRRLAPAKLASIVGGGGQAPRAVIASIDCPNFARQGAVEATARNLQARFREMSQILGISFPVYVLLNRADGLPFFADYAANLSETEIAEVWGVTLPLQPSRETGLYAEIETKRVSAAFDAIFYDLDGRRADLLRREHDASKLPGVYEFPREYRKLRPPLVQALVDLCRPSQLVVGPFLRGFYLAGQRTITVSAGVADIIDRGPITTSDAPVGATRVFDVKKLRAQASVQEAPPAGATHVFDVRKLKASGGLDTSVGLPSAQTRTVQQPLFLPHLFTDVLLRDRAALGASGASTKVGFWRRFLLAAATALFLVFSVGFLVSYICNQGLVTQVDTANQSLNQTLPTSALQPSQLPSSDAIDALGRLSDALDSVSQFQRNGYPFRFGWWLYVGDRLYPVACKDYSTAFDRLLLQRTQGVLLSRLHGLPAKPGPNDDFNKPYDTLKAYLITTSEGARSTRDFLSPVLMDAWSEGINVDPGLAAKVRPQFDFYSDELRYSSTEGAPDCFSVSVDSSEAAVSHARAYLNQFPAQNRAYRAMLADAGHGGKPVNLNVDFPESKGVVNDAQTVPAAFTPAGWSRMQDALLHPDRYVRGEDWVLKSTGGAQDLVNVTNTVRSQYQAEYIEAWSAFLRNAHVVAPQDAKDASMKLDVLSGNRSPLMELFWEISCNTDPSKTKDDSITRPFTAARSTVPLCDQNLYVGDSNKGYLDSLGKLKLAMDDLAKNPTGTAESGEVSNAAQAARGAVAQVARGFAPEEHGLDKAVEKLLGDPITDVDAVLPKPGAGLNKAGQGFCGQFDTLIRKSPFNQNATTAATLQDFNSVFQPSSGSLWAFYSQGLANLLAQGTSGYVAKPDANPAPSPAFVTFFNKAATVTQKLYPNQSQNPQLTYSLKVMGVTGVTTFTLSLDGKELQYPGSSTPVQFNWPGSTTQGGSIVVDGVNGLFPGVFGAFGFFADTVNQQRSGNGYTVDLPVNKQVTVGRVGTSSQSATGKITFYVDAGDSASTRILLPGYFSGCVSKVVVVAQ